MHDHNFLEDFHDIKFEDFLNHFIFLKNEKKIPTGNDDEEESTATAESAEPLEGKNNKPQEGKHNFMRSIANDIINNEPSTVLFRRMYWPLLLGIYHPATLHDLTKDVQKKRSLYKQDKDEYITKQSNLNIQKLDPQIFHPLSSDDKNPWTLKQKNQELNEEIKQDILRTHSEKKLFQNEAVRDALCKILFLWAKKNPSVSYKQGMNELVAIFFIINYREQVCPDVLNLKSDQFWKEYVTLFDRDEVEADTYILFDHFMNMGLKYLFSSPEEKKNQATKNSSKTVLLHKCTYIFHKLLKNLDKLLYNHLISLSIEPQIFLLRWIRLFYCREFPIDDTVILWDNFFSDCFLTNWEKGFPAEVSGDTIEVAHMTSNVFPLVDYFAISMILFIRSFLLENDENYCLKRLFKYPPVENVRILIDLSFKIKARSEKKEKGAKKDDLPVSNSVGVDGGSNVGGCLGSFPARNGAKEGVASLAREGAVSLAREGAVSLAREGVANLAREGVANLARTSGNNSIASDHLERNRYKPTANTLVLNKETKILNTPATLSRINSKLNGVIDSLNNLSFTVGNEKHRVELQQNVFRLSEIFRELKSMEHNCAESMPEDLEMNWKREAPPIYFG
ncbi:GTPase-activating protein, putative [Plasmodium vivax]|nr:GTPase-activating protein, putative [Plasmodium vivax]